MTAVLDEKTKQTYTALTELMNGAGFVRRDRGDTSQGYEGAVFVSVERNRSGHVFTVLVNHTDEEIDLIMTGYDDATDRIVCSDGCARYRAASLAGYVVANIVSRSLREFLVSSSRTSAGDTKRLSEDQRAVLSSMVARGHVLAA